MPGHPGHIFLNVSPKVPKKASVLTIAKSDATDNTDALGAKNGEVFSVFALMLTVLKFLCGTFHLW